MSGTLLTGSPVVDEDVWADGELVIVATPNAAGVPGYQLTTLERQTQKMVVTTEGLRFWKHTLSEVKGARTVIPAFAPVFPILRAQLATHEHRKAISEKYWAFLACSDRDHAAALAAVVHDFLASTQ